MAIKAQGSYRHKVPVVCSSANSKRLWNTAFLVRQVLWISATIGACLSEVVSYAPTTAIEPAVSSEIHGSPGKIPRTYKGPEKPSPGGVRPMDTPATEGKCKRSSLWDRVVDPKHYMFGCNEIEVRAGRYIPIPPADCAAECHARYRAIVLCVEYVTSSKGLQKLVSITERECMLRKGVASKVPSTSRYSINIVQRTFTCRPIYSRLPGESLHQEDCT